MGIRQPIGSWEWQPVGTAVGPYAASLMACMDKSTSHAAADYEPLVVASPGQLQGGVVKLSVAPGAGRTRTFDLYKNGATAGLQFVFTGADYLKRDDAFTLDCVPGDRLWWQDANTNTPLASNVLIHHWFYNSTPKTWWASGAARCQFGYQYGTSWDAEVNGATGEYEYPKDRIALFTMKVTHIRVFGKVAVPAGQSITWLLRKNYVTVGSFVQAAGEATASWTGSVSLAAGDNFNILPIASAGIASLLFWYVGAAFENVDHLHATQRTSRSGIGAQTNDRWTNIAQNDYATFLNEASVICYAPIGLRIRGYGIRYTGNTYVINEDRFYRTWVAQTGGVDHWQKDYKSTGVSTTSYVNYHNIMDVALVDEFTTAAEWERLSIHYNKNLGSAGAPYQRDLMNSLWIEGSAVPAPTLCTPATGLQGHTLDVVVTGTNLGEVTAASFGVNITVNSVTVDSDTQLTVNITCGAVAETVDVVLTNPKGTGTLASGFQVLPNGPVVTSVTPASGLQGAL